MARVDIETAHNIVLQFELSTISERLLAYIIDLIILSIYIAIISAVIAGFSLPDFIYFIVIIPVIFMYHIGCELYNQGQSLGKYIMKLRVISLDGHKLTIKSILLRWSFRLIDISSSAGIVGILSILSTPRHQRLGDIVAGTGVIHLKRNATSGLDMIKEIQKIEHNVTYPEVTIYNDQDMLLVKEALQRAHKNDASRTLLRDLTKQIKSDLKIDQPTNPQKLLSTVLEDYVYLTR